MRHAFSLLMISSLAVLLSACAIYDKPSRDLPVRDSLIEGQTVTVSGNQSIYAIARANNVSMRDIIVLNGLQPPFALRPGQSLVLPATADTPSVAQPSSLASSTGIVTSTSSAVEAIELSPMVTQNAPQPSSQAVMPKTSPAVDALNAPRPAEKPVETTTMAPLPAPKPAAVSPAPTVTATTATTPLATATPHFIWPVEGQVVSGFGPSATGGANDGINIAAPKGSPIKAAEGGTVVYADNEMKGFGNLVLIRHQGGWVTAYAHLDRMLVSKDTIVARGDMIGTVGKSGDVKSTQLHFEIRHNGTPTDPKPLIQ